MALIKPNKVDAVIAWDVFGGIREKTVDFVDLPREQQVYRSTGVGVVSYSENKELANEFVRFLLSDASKKIYEKYGWFRSIP